MIRSGAIALSIAGAIWSFSNGMSPASATGEGIHSQGYGEASPPIGFVHFCTEQPAACSYKSSSRDTLSMTPERWALVHKVNSSINDTTVAVSDQQLYGKSEYWTYPHGAGDCEDYVLAKQLELRKLGLPAGSLLITVVLDEKKEGHAVLTLVTAEGDFILDNRTNDIKAWNETGYSFLKRQSQQAPRLWVALTPDKRIKRNSRVLAGFRRP